jgi:hypothetical protein
MRTVVISDAHLGTPHDSDLLRRPELREPLLELLRASDRLVVLGDGFELRHTAQRDAAELARPFLEDVGRALGPHGHVLLLAGNHDHALVSPWIDGRLNSEPAGFLELEQCLEPAEAGPLSGRIAELLAPARTRVAYPGVWLRDDVYAFHGHYGDLHTTVPTFERVVVGSMARWAVNVPADGAAPDDYEAALAPVYAWMNQLTQRSDRAVAGAAAGASTRGWTLLTAGRRRGRPLRTAAMRSGYAAAVAGLNLAGLGPLWPGLSPRALRRAGLHGIREVLRRLEVRAPYVLFGHTHRSGPWPGDDLAEWTTEEGSRLVNTGSWVYQPHFLSDEPNTSPYWPGTAVVLEDRGPPELRRLLGSRGHPQLRGLRA